MQLSADDVEINAQNGTFQSHWQEAQIKINPLDLLIHPNTAFESLHLLKGKLLVQNKPIFNVPTVDIIAKNQQYNIKTSLSNNHQQLFIQFMFIPHQDTTEINNLQIDALLSQQTISLKIPNIYLTNDDQINDIKNIYLTLNDQALTGELTQISLQPQFSANGHFTAPAISLDKIINLNGFLLQLQKLTIDFVIPKQITQHTSATLSISAHAAKLTGIDLNTLASSTHQLLNAVKNGDGVGGAFQTLKTQLLPLLSQDQLISNPAKTTHFNRLSIQSDFSDNLLRTNTISWQAPEFTITGHGQINITENAWQYPLNINILGEPSFSIPYALNYQNKQFTAAVNQNQLHKNITPIIEKALTNALNNKLGSFFR